VPAYIFAIQYTAGIHVGISGSFLMKFDGRRLVQRMQKNRRDAASTPPPPAAPDCCA
jgi:hypothetical protein